MLQVCYGGTFDPVHLGHLAIARTVRDALDARVALLPAADPPHKAGTHAPASERLAMLQLALAPEPGLSVDTRELERPGPSYTVDTLAGLREASGPQQPIAWLVGGDSLHALDTWHRWRTLFELAHVLAVARPGAPVDTAVLKQHAPGVHAEVAPRWRAAGDLQRSPSGGFAVLQLPTLRTESSTAVRTLVASRGAWQALVPPAVALHIESRGLYRGGASTPAPL
jgi:nicotinate-nucleotide adenylyltransferase